ncbi:hypothetical protein M885DRAFT_110651 [Pelagophyceae sp. CCMP2097]|nr:hypothetical protein M885DRAFT_110651 [Pelagophyceae sp. CCMP2097]
MQALLRRRGLFLPLRRLCVGGDWRESIGTPKQTSELVVRNLPYGATSNDLRRAFGPVAHVTNVKISVDRTTGQNLGWAFVRILSNEADVETVLAEMHGSALRGRQLSVALASPEDRAHITPKERRPRTEDEDEQSAADARQWQIYKSRDTGDWFHRATPGSRTVALQKIAAPSRRVAARLRFTLFDCVSHGRSHRV